MAAATQTNLGARLAVPFLVTQFELSAMTAEQQETLTHGGPLGIVPFQVHFDILDRPTSGEGIFMEHVSDSSSTGTSTLRFYGGDLTGATVRVSFWFNDQARQDGQSISQVNNT